MTKQESVVGNCVKPREGETPSEEFARQGGVHFAVETRLADDVFATDGIEEGRILRGYDRLRLVIHHFGPESDDRGNLLARARAFLWDHWRDRKYAYLTLTSYGIDASGTSHVFIEKEQGGRWRVVWRLVGDDGVTYVPPLYSVEWVIPGRLGEPGTVPPGASPDWAIDELQFRDKCGEAVQRL